ncbi:MAG: hypothetical protein H6740_07510 [Alphaproteobacteria bacterium]|nr:hypothetical protein [Alphaproteobacteria bacterium]
MPYTRAARTAANKKVFDAAPSGTSVPFIASGSQVFLGTVNDHDAAAFDAVAKSPYLWWGNLLIRRSKLSRGIVEIHAARSSNELEEALWEITKKPLTLVKPDGTREALVKPAYLKD